jgi:DNA polymerase-3 subunit chi
MPKIDFYIIPTSSDKDRLEFACRLIEKIYKQQRRIYIHTENQVSAHQLDELLWTYREDSFLPHHLYGEGPEPVPPIQIGYGVEPKQHRDVLINLSNSIPVFYKSFSRVLELISQDPAITSAGRERYKQYRAENSEITTHKLETSTEV